MEGILVANEYIVMMIDSLVKKNKMLEELKKLTNNQSSKELLKEKEENMDGKNK